MNGMVFNRGSPLDWDNWANVTGDPSWTYDQMLPFMKKLENYEGDYALTGKVFFYVGLSWPDLF